MNEKKIKNCKEKENTGCTGGTSEYITYYDSTEVLFSGSVYHCGGQDYGNMKGEIKSFANEMRALIVDLDSLLKK